MEDEYIETENHPNANLLDRVEHFIRRFCVLPSEHCYVAMTLWVAHAHMIEHFTTTPRLAFISPEAASGKTRALEILHLLVPNSELSLQASPATIFRTLAEGQITLLLDEVDTIFKAHSKDDNNEYLRCLLNSGYRRGATIPRCVGPMHEVQRFPVFCAVALAGIGDLPDTIMTRSVIFNMRRRTPGEKMEGFRLRLHEDEGHDLREELKVWGENRGARVGQAWPKLPPGIEDRDAEVWEPLVAVADDPWGHWPERARKACVNLVDEAHDRRVSVGVRLLGDLRTIFCEERKLSTQEILHRLANGENHGLEADAPWSDLKGSPLDARRMASILREYGVKPKKIDLGPDGKLQG